MKQIGILFFALHLVGGSINLFVQGQSVTSIVGTGEKGFSGDGGPADQARLNNPFAIARGPDGNLYLCDVDNHRIRKIAPNGIISTVVGNGTRGYQGDGGPAIEASLNQPYELAWDPHGNLYFVEIGNHVVRRVDAKTGVLTTVAGNGTAGFEGDDGPAQQAKLNQPHSLVFDARGDLLVCDILNHRIRKIDLQTNKITTWGGTGEKKTAPTGTLYQGAALHGPRALALSPNGDIWLALREGNAILRLDTKMGILVHVAGTGKSGFTGNGGPALEATLSGPKCLALDRNGNVYLADTESHSIRYIDIEKGSMELLVGDGKKGDGPDGDPLTCQLARPHGLFADLDGSILIGDSENHRIRRWAR